MPVASKPVAGGISSLNHRLLADIPAEMADGWQPYDPEKAGARPRGFHDAHKVWLEVAKSQ